MENRYYVNTTISDNGVQFYIICDRESKKLDGSDRTLDNTKAADQPLTERICGALNRNWNEMHRTSI